MAPKAPVQGKVYRLQFQSKQNRPSSNWLSSRTERYFCRDCWWGNFFRHFWISSRNKGSSAGAYDFLEHNYSSNLRGVNLTAGLPQVFRECADQEPFYSSHSSSSPRLSLRQKKEIPESQFVHTGANLLSRKHSLIFHTRSIPEQRSGICIIRYVNQIGKPDKVNWEERNFTTNKRVCKGTSCDDKASTTSSIRPTSARESDFLSIKNGKSMKTSLKTSSFETSRSQRTLL